MSTKFVSPGDTFILEPVDIKFRIVKINHDKTDNIVSYICVSLDDPELIFVLKEALQLLAKL